MTSSNEITLNMKPTNFERRYDIDWLRIIAIFLVFIYHCSRFFDEREWHVKNDEHFLIILIFTGNTDLKRED